MIIFVLLGQSAFAAASADDDAYLNAVRDMISDQYYGSLSDGQLNGSSIEEIFDALDDYTMFLPADKMNTYIQSVTGVFGGIGISMEMGEKYILIVDVFPGSPAEKSGLRQGDKIVEVDGISIDEASANELSAMIKGEEGTKVKLGIIRNVSGNQIYYVNVVRKIINVNPILYEIRNGISYIKIESFYENTNKYLTEVLDKMDEAGIKNIVLDMRDNPGGEVSAAVSVAENFVPKGKITTLDFKSIKYTDVEYDSENTQCKYKLAVLVNENTASASEIVAGAIQDTGVGIIIGTKTYGKAKFQSVLPVLSKEAYLKYCKQLGVQVINGLELYSYGTSVQEDELAGYAKMTLGVYYTPSGRMIDLEGLTPDITVEDPEPVSGIDVRSIEKLTKVIVPALNAQGAAVNRAEKLLKMLGYNVGKIDTTLDADTLQAIMQYQKDRGLPVWPYLSFATQDALNDDYLKLINKYDTQYNAAVKALSN
jgi:carboxyl-terminal processing protease